MSMKNGGSKTPLRRAKIQVIQRVSQILRCLEGESLGLSLGQIAKRTDLPRSTVQRIIGTLIDEGFVSPATPQGRVRLGPILMRLAATARTDLTSVAHPYVEALSHELDETVDVAILHGVNIVFVDQVVSPNRRLRAVSRIGAEYPAHSCASGKVILAFADHETVESVVEAGFEKFTKNTLSKPEALFRELDEIRTTGIALDHEEHTEGISAMAATIQDAYGNLAAISVPMPSQRFRERHALCLRSLKDTCRKINSALVGEKDIKIPA